ncbi:MAG: sugar phosphate isomerase/epimerase [Armatimonadetes bacterium]|nr:sugar phosphate isomerase/epimerase [Armatimonadota bacterium]
MDLSTSLNVLWEPPRISAEEAVERVAAAGFQALDMNFCDWLFDGSPFVGEAWESWVRGIRRRADAVGIRFGQAHGPIFNKFAEGERTRWLTAMSHRSLVAAGILGAPRVVFEPGTLGGGFDAAHLARTKQRNLDWFGALLPDAAQSGVGLALENNADLSSRERGTRRSFCSTPAELVDLVDTFATPRVGICWDTGHAHLQRLDQGPAIRALGQRLKVLHIQDNNGDSDQHLLPFNGTVDWRAVMGALRNIGYPGTLSFEVHASIRLLPDGLRDAALHYAVAVGRYLTGLE